MARPPKSRAIPKAELYSLIQDLSQIGIGNRTIAKLTGIGRTTVLAAMTAEYRARRLESMAEIVWPLLSSDLQARIIAMRVRVEYAQQRSTRNETEPLGSVISE